MGKATELSHRAKVFVGGEEYVPKVLFVEYIDEQLSKMREDCENDDERKMVDMFSIFLNNTAIR